MDLHADLCFQQGYSPETSQEKMVSTCHFWENLSAQNARVSHCLILHLAELADPDRNAH